MIAFFPQPFPGELAYSLFSRFHLYSGYTTHKAAMQDLYCKRSDTPSKEFIGNLNSDAQKVLYPMIDELVLNHTMYRQYARFIPLAQKENALRHLGWTPPMCTTFSPSCPERRESSFYGTVQFVHKPTAGSTVSHIGIPIIKYATWWYVPGTDVASNHPRYRLRVSSVLLSAPQSSISPIRKPRRRITPNYCNLLNIWRLCLMCRWT